VATNCSPAILWMMPVAPNAPVSDSVPPTTIGSPDGGATADGDASADADGLPAVDSLGAADGDDEAGEQATTRAVIASAPSRFADTSFT
jgi:hypothetical protein